jgi:hypothetical protein
MVASPINQQIIEKLHQLDEAQKEQVLQFVSTLQQLRIYTPRDLMQLPREEQRKYIAAAFQAAAEIDFETFEA